jgi:alkanesulfonate monooxygenase SsuD/methylene tetrahydromethanopterin reductase-like flavin-dependent oxidoreductase (luciferase family)
MMRFGAGLWGPFPLRRYVEYATLAERQGFDVAWIGDTQLLTPDLYSVLALPRPPGSVWAAASPTR